MIDAWTVGRGRPSTLVWALAAIATGITVIPVGYVVLITLASGASLPALLLQPRVGELITATIAVVCLAVPAAIALGVGAAWAVERTALRGRRAWAAVLAAPLVIPAFVTSYGWVSALPAFGGLPAAVVVATLAYYPLIYLPVAAGLRRADPALEEVAASLGHPPARVFATVVLPQLRVPILGGALLVALHLLAEYGAFAMLRFDTFTVAIVQRYRTAFAGPTTAALAIVLVALCLLVLAGESRLRGQRRFARLGRGAERPVRLVTNRRVTLPTTMLVTGVALFALGVPFASIVRWVGYAGIDAWAEPRVVASLAQSVGLGFAGAALAVAMALPMAVLTVRHPSRLARVLESGSYVAGSLPGIIVALAFASATIRVLPGLYQTVPVLVLAYALLFFPRALVSLRTGIAQAPPILEEVARSLGKSPLQAFRLVTARLVLPSAAAGGALAFLGTVNELTATLLIAPIGTRTLATSFWTHVIDLDYAAAAPYAVLMIAVSVPMVWLFGRADARPIARG